MNNIITLRIRYKKNGSIQKVSIELNRDRATCEEIAELFAKKLTSNYANFLGGKKNMKELRRYEFGQYKLILPYFERLEKSW